MFQSYFESSDIFSNNIRLSSLTGTCEIRYFTFINDNRFIELFVKCSLEVCAKRDDKGMYKKARSGELDNFSGVTAPYEIPNNPELIIDTENNSIEDCVKDILNYLKSNNLLSPTI